MTSGTHLRAVRLGFLYPGNAAEDDYPRLATALGHDVLVEVVHTPVREDAHRVDALLDLGAQERLLPPARAFVGRRPDAVMWACTSGSFVFGWDGAGEQVAALEKLLEVSVSSTSFAFVSATHALGLRRVAVAATYPEDVAGRFRDFLAAGGLDVVSLGSRGIVTAAEVATLDRDDVRRMAMANDRPDAECVLLPDTAMHTAPCIEELEQACGKPVLTANQVTVWLALRLAGRQEPHDGLGQLFRHSLPVARGEGG